MTKKDSIIIPRWFLEEIENTLRIENNINLDKETGETCQDRNIRQSLNGVRKLLNGEELTGMERIEKLQPSLPSNLDEAANNYSRDIRLGYPRVMDETDKYIYNAFKAGAEWMAEQFQQVQPDVDLEKVFAHEYAIYHLPNSIIASIEDGTELIDFIYKTAHHFYELGLNARKEE